MAKLENEFKSPGNLYRGKPFWAWNGLLDEGELRRQIRVMQRMGLGGFFMHSRVGLATPYLGQEWFDLTKACIDEAKKLDMEAWLYDEDRWPSGAAGGIVTKDPRYRQRRLRVDVGPKVKWDADTIAAFEAKVNGDKATEVKRLKKGQKPSKGKTGLVFRNVLAGCSPWYNGYTYLDTMSHEAVKKFIEVTHDAYRKEIGEDFGGAVPGIFTDEPNHGSTLRNWNIDQLGAGGDEIPWTNKLPAVFRQRYGYDLIARLPEIFFDVDGQVVSNARIDYHDCKTFLFVDAFARQIGEWCDKYNMMHTGHVLEEPTTRTQTNVVGAAMRFYEYMQAPGIDILCDQMWELDTAKQTASVLNQTGGRWMLSELYGCTGWDFPFEGQKRVGDWQAALGVNLRCQHLSWYTMAGEAKRDYPASIFHHSPWWELYPTVEDYYSRVGVLMSHGKPVRDLLVVHPIESAWARCRVGWWDADDTKQISNDMVQVRDWLLNSNIDFDYGDEEMMSRLSRLKKDKDGVRFTLGKASYKAILVPKMLTIRSSTLALLKRFAAAGGTVVFAGDPPKYVDGLPGDAAVELAASVKNVPFEAQKVVRATAVARVISLKDERGREYEPSLYQLRRDKDACYLYIINRERYKDSGPLTLTVPFGKSAEEWDPMTGERFAADYTQEGNGLVISTSLVRTGHRCFVISNTRSRLKPRPKVKVAREAKIVQKRWNIVLDEPNVLVLDRPKFRTDSGKWRPAMEILKLDREIRTEAGFYHRGGGMVQPWAREKSTKPPIPLQLKYSFEVDAIPSGAVYLAVEQADLFCMEVNGQPLNLDAKSGWWVDVAINKVPVDPSLLRLGMNEIVLCTDYHEDHDLEASFLLGDFGVSLDGTAATLTTPPSDLRLGDWVNQGLTFYSAAVTYRTTLKTRELNGKRLFINIPEFAGSCVRFLVDGQPVSTAGWPPYETDLTPYLTGKSHEIGIQVYSSRRNSFGPLHQAPPVPGFVGPGSFVTSGKEWIEKYHLRPCGLLKPPVLSWRVVK